MCHPDSKLWHSIFDKSLYCMVFFELTNEDNRLIILVFPLGPVNGKYVPN